jgi:hypothetical protein
MACKLRAALPQAHEEATPDFATPAADIPVVVLGAVESAVIGEAFHAGQDLSKTVYLDVSRRRP